MAEIEHDTGAEPPTTAAHIMYFMHAISPFTAWTLSILAVLIGAITRDSVRGTYVETHYSWLLRTFLWLLLWALVATGVSVLLAITIVGVLVIWLPWLALAIWYLYRVIRGWMLLNERKPAPA